MFKKLLFGLFIVVNAFSAANVTTIPGATAIQFYFRNYTYANLALDLPILSMGLATDLNKLVYRNSIGNMYKIMVDASGSSNTPQNRVFYADVNGSATASTNFTFNGTDLYINSSNTSTINTGRVTGTDFEASDSIKGVTGAFSGALTVDSLKSTKGINATGGTFSGRITGSDVEVSDSIKGVTGTFSGALTGTTLNTGYGANELHPMNQGVRTTDDVTFDSTRTRVSVFDSLKIGSASYLNVYLDTTFTANIYEDNTLMTTAQLSVVQIGKMIMMYVPTITITKVGVGSEFIFRGIPSKFIPSVSMYCHVIVISNGNYMTGYAEVGNPFVLGATNDANNMVRLAPGTSGVAQSIITWIIN